jgi:CheY-like chemotaxis protein
MSSLPSVLLVEDDETDVFLLRRAFKQADLQNPVHVARDGQEAIDFLARPWLPPDHRPPSLVILDLKMPRRTGIDVLKWMREQSVLRLLPAMIFSSSANRDDIERAYALGANAFLVKPPSLAERLELAHFIRQWLLLNQPPRACIEGFGAAQSIYATHFGRMPPEAGNADWA